MNLPDAPYIREAEAYGLPHYEPVHCPVCGEKCDTIYAAGSTVFGCEHCVDVMDADTWWEEENEH